MSIDEVGNRYGRWTVIERVGKTNGSWNWLCRCACGETKVLCGGVLRRGISKSCGCLQKELASARNSARLTTHGKTNSSEYTAWKHILDRCCNPLSRQYRNYGGRGISIAPEWRHDFSAFLNHIGLRPSKSHSIDRIKNDLGYIPGNVRWATQSEQMRNTRCNRLITHGGRTLCVAAWSEELGISRKTIFKRLRNGHLPFEERRARSL